MNKRYVFLVGLILFIAISLTACTLPNYFASMQLMEKGNENFDAESYEKAVEYYDKAIKANPHNATAYGNKSAALNFLGSYDEALEAANKALEIAPKEEMLHLNRGDALNSLGDYEDSLVSLNKAIELNEKLSDAYISKGTVYYNMNRYEDALKELDIAIKLDNGLEDAYLWKVQVYMGQKNYEKALEACNGAALKFQSPESYYKKAQILLDMNKPSEALVAIDSAIAADPKIVDYYIEKISMLYDLRDYDRCIQFGLLTLKLFPKAEEVNWYIADSYSAQLIHDKAASYYAAELQINPNNDQVAAYTGWEYFYMQDYKMAQKYADIANSLYRESYEANSLQEELKKTRLPDAERIVDFVNTNYLYLSDVKDFESKSKEFIKDQDLTPGEIAAYVNSIRVNHDLFTYVVSGEEYNLMMQEDLSSQVRGYQITEGTYYIRIGAFTPSTGYAFGKELRKIKEPQTKNLVIDLRGNFGGLIDSSNNILDYMLPDCTTSYTIDRNGYIDSYQSDEKQYKFNKILVLVDEDSASSSELLALGLKKYLDNVVIVGKPTFGKGVGQNIYEDKKKKYMIFLVSFYWNVLEENISGTRIYPDIKLKSNSQADYEKAIYNLTK